MTKPNTIYECGICDCLHPWDWEGDCRENANRFGSPEDFAKARGISIYDVEVLPMEDRVAADALAFDEGAEGEHAAHELGELDDDDN